MKEVINIESALQVVHSNDGYCHDLTPEENEVLDNLAIIISDHLLNSQK